MDGRYADRRQIFDIGIAGPLAGLVVAVPVMWLGVQQLDLATQNGLAGAQLHMPLGIKLLLQAVGPENLRTMDGFWLGHLAGNPLFMAGWVGFVITGVNMLPVSQLDGGHVIYCLFGRRSRWIARGTLLGAIVFIVAAKAYAWALMVLIVMLIGPDHPPTRNDNARLGVVRTILGLASLSIPILCLPAQPITQ
jgi:membrane-associated protease RseP (regulator of RpoE activity)